MKKIGAKNTREGESSKEKTRRNELIEFLASYEPLDFTPPAE